MCRAHRIIVRFTVALWAVILPATWFTHGLGPARTLTIVFGCLAAVLVPYCLFPWLMRDMLQEQLADYCGSFLAGWEAAKEDDPREPTRLTRVA